MEREVWVLKGDGRGLKFQLKFLCDHKIQAVVLIFFPTILLILIPAIMLILIPASHADPDPG